MRGASAGAYCGTVLREEILAQRDNDLAWKLTDAASSSDCVRLSFSPTFFSSPKMIASFANCKEHICASRQEIWRRRCCLMRFVRLGRVGRTVKTRTDKWHL